jgi:hypothetical protein
MKHHLNRPFTVRTWHIAAFLVGLVLAFSTSLVVLARPEAAPSALFPAGTVRLARIARTNVILVPATNTFTEVLDLKFRVPAGKTADVMASFNAEAEYENPPEGYCYGHFQLDGQILGPDSDNGFWIVDGDVYPAKFPTLFQQGATNTPIGSGKHHLRYEIRCNTNELNLFDRSIMAWINIH